MKIEDEIKQTRFNNLFHKAEINIIFTAAWLQSSFSAHLKPHGLSPQQFNILRILRGQSPESLSMSDIRERMIDKESNASRIVDKLVLKKLVSRSSGDTDRRQVKVCINERGLALLKTLDTILEEHQNNHNCLSDDELSTLSNLLDKLRSQPVERT